MDSKKSKGSLLTNYAVIKDDDLKIDCKRQLTVLNLNNSPVNPYHYSLDKLLLMLVENKFDESLRYMEKHADILLQKTINCNNSNDFSLIVRWILSTNNVNFSLKALHYVGLSKTANMTTIIWEMVEKKIRERFSNKPTKYSYSISLYVYMMGLRLIFEFIKILNVCESLEIHKYYFKFISEDICYRKLTRVFFSYGNYDGLKWLKSVGKLDFADCVGAELYIPQNLKDDDVKQYISFCEKEGQQIFKNENRDVFNVSAISLAVWLLQNNFRINFPAENLLKNEKYIEFAIRNYPFTCIYPEYFFHDLTISLDKKIKIMGLIFNIGINIKYEIRQKCIIEEGITLSQLESLYLLEYDFEGLIDPPYNCENLSPIFMFFLFEFWGRRKYKCDRMYFKFIQKYTQYNYTAKNMKVISFVKLHKKSSEQFFKSIRFFKLK